MKIKKYHQKVWKLEWPLLSMIIKIGKNGEMATSENLKIKKQWLRKGTRHDGVWNNLRQKSAMKSQIAAVHENAKKTILLFVLMGVVWMLE